MLRPSWDLTWMSVAEKLAERSRCESRGVGAVIVTDDNRPVAVGYNGPPRGLDFPIYSTCGSWCSRRQNNDQTTSYDNCVTVHAEINALMFADRRDYDGGTLYVTSSICWDCGKAVANSGIARIVCMIDWDRDGHRNPQRTIDFLYDCGIDVDIFYEQGAPNA